MKCNLSAVILAGGESRRIGGKPKTELIVAGEKIISRMLGVIREIFDEIIIVTNSPGRFSKITDCLIIRDIYAGSGPLGGIHAAIKSSGNEALFIFAGDMPFLDKNLINRQIEFFAHTDFQALVPVVNGMTEPLHAIYCKSIIDEAEILLEQKENPSVRDLLEKIRTGYMHLEHSAEVNRSFTNINTLADLRQAENFYL